MPLPAALAGRLRLPAIAAPMFLVSGPDLVVAACQAGVIGSFPTANCRTLDDLDEWLERIAGETAGAAPFAPNLIVHKSNQRLAEDTALVVKHRAPMVIASVGSPAPIMDAIKGYGGLVFADIASMRHAEKAIATGVDGLILLTAGAGGHAGLSLFQAELRHLPYELTMMERHPEGSQAFLPMTSNPFLVIVAPDEKGRPGTPVAFLTAPHQGVNFHKATWHGVLETGSGLGRYPIKMIISGSSKLVTVFSEVSTSLS